MIFIVFITSYIMIMIKIKIMIIIMMMIKIGSLRVPIVGLLHTVLDRRVAGSKGGASLASQHNGDDDDDDDCDGDDDDCNDDRDNDFDSDTDLWHCALCILWTNFTCSDSQMRVFLVLVPFMIS